MTGGEMNHTLTLDEMPAHNHQNGIYDGLVMADGSYTVQVIDSSSNGEINLGSKGSILT